MLSRLILLACAGAACVAAEPAAAGAAPWSLSFTTGVRGKDRQFVEVGGKTFLLVELDEIASGVLDGQDIALTGKLRRLPGDQFNLYRADGVVVVAVGNALSGRLEGDNVHLAGTLRNTNGKRTFAVSSSSPAPSDAQLLQARLAGIQDDEWDRRLGVVSWCHEQARTAGNVEAWNASAESLLLRIIADMAARAGERKDAAMVIRAIDLALNQIKDPGLAARLSSPIWIREHGGAPAEAVSRRMRGLGFALYKNQWMPRPQAAEREFEDRFAALTWKDADGFYQLGRWADDNAESLPRARERSWRCYQAGRQADPGHAGIARELGMQAAAAATVSGAPPAPAALDGEILDLVDPDSGLRIPAPANWKRAPPQGGNPTWKAPGSDTATISIRVLRPPVDAAATWSVIEAEAKARTGYSELGGRDAPEGERRTMALRSLWMDAGQSSMSAVVLTLFGEGKPAFMLEGRCLQTEQALLDQAMKTAADGATIQAAPEPAPH